MNISSLGLNDNVGPMPNSAHFYKEEIVNVGAYRTISG